MWVQRQTWLDLLFAHWPVPVQELRAAVPAELPIDTYDGTAWLGVVPFRITGVRAYGLPLPGFLETNVRTYTTVAGRPGVYFFSLDAESRLAVRGARLLYHLPYFHARMALERGRYRSRRAGATLDVAYAPAGEIFHAAPGTLEHFLVERYRLFTVHRGRVYGAEIEHSPWSLQPAEAEFAENAMTTVPLAGEPLLHFSRRQDVRVGPLVHQDGRRGRLGLFV